MHVTPTYEEAKPTYFVIRADMVENRTKRQRATHSSRVSARKEALRLAAKHPGAEFIVVKKKEAYQADDTCYPGHFFKAGDFVRITAGKGVGQHARIVSLKGMNYAEVKLVTSDDGSFVKLIGNLEAATFRDVFSGLASNPDVEMSEQKVFKPRAVPVITFPSRTIDEKLQIIRALTTKPKPTPEELKGGDVCLFNAPDSSLHDRLVVITGTGEIGERITIQGVNAQGSIIKRMCRPDQLKPVSIDDLSRYLKDSGKDTA